MYFRHRLNQFALQHPVVRVASIFMSEHCVGTHRARLNWMDRVDKAYVFAAASIFRNRRSRFPILALLAGSGNIAGRCWE